MAKVIYHNTIDIMPRHTPFEIQRELMLRLPVASLIRFRRVSRSWRQTINRSSFQRLYGARRSNTCSFILAYRNDAESFMFNVNIDLNFIPNRTGRVNTTQLTPFATSEGLWCFSVANDIALVVWNPSIERNVTVVTYVPGEPAVSKLVFGFGVCPVTMDPIFLKIHLPREIPGPWFVAVFSLASNMWSILEEYRLPPHTINIKRSSHVTVGGKIFWIGSERFIDEDGNLYKKYLLVSYNMEHSYFQVEDIPAVVRSSIPPPISLAQLGNSLVIWGTGISRGLRVFRGWALDDGLISTIREIFTLFLPFDHIVKLLGFTEDSMPIFEIGILEQMFPHTLHVWNQRLQILEIIPGIQGNAGSFFMGQYKESLTLLTIPLGRILH